MKKDVNYTVTKDKFLEDGRRFKIVRKSDFLSYREFVDYFSGQTVVTKHDLIIGINFTYGWMPTIFKFQSDDPAVFEAVVATLNKIKQNDLPTILEVDQLISLLNHSLVGASKLMHFINPEKIAIWDSRVYRYLTGKDAHGNISRCDLFFKYMNLCTDLTQNIEYDSVHSFIEKEVGYAMTKFRTAELIMYTNGNKIKK